MRRAPIAQPDSALEAGVRARRARCGGLSVRAERNVAGPVSERHVGQDILRWTFSTVLAVIVVAVLLLIGMLV